MDDDDLVLCLCFGERIPAEQARRSGCDQRGGCPELRDAIPLTEGEFDT